MRNKKQIATITFHASHNHGSCLQAYALQKFIQNEFPNTGYHIINFYTDKQKSLYGKPYNVITTKSLIKRLIFTGYKKKILERKQNFEKFVNSKLSLTQEYSTLEGLKRADLHFDYYISGSDQLWNHALSDFDWSFFLEFCDTKNGGQKISYAASFGSKSEKWSPEDLRRARKDLQDYKHISVREPASAAMVKKIINREPEINVDPTLLIDEEDWDKLVGDRLIQQDYIFLYDLKGLKRSYDIAKRLSKEYKLPVVIVKENSKRHLFYHFIKKYEAGPFEFLNYMKYAKFIVSSSFHGTVFATIFQKPFLAVDGNTDFRISNLLKNMGLTDRGIASVGELSNKKDLFTIDYSSRDKVIRAEQKRSQQYFKKALDE